MSWKCWLKIEAITEQNKELVQYIIPIKTETEETPTPSFKTPLDDDANGKIIKEPIKERIKEYIHYQGLIWGNFQLTIIFKKCLVVGIRMIDTVKEIYCSIGNLEIKIEVDYLLIMT